MVLRDDCCFVLGVFLNEILLIVTNDYNILVQNVAFHFVGTRCRVRRRVGDDRLDVLELAVGLAVFLEHDLSDSDRLV